MKHILLRIIMINDTSVFLLLIGLLQDYCHMYERQSTTPGGSQDSPGRQD